MSVARETVDGEIVGEFANAYIVRREDGSTYSINRSLETEIGIIHGYEQFLESSDVEETAQFGSGAEAVAVTTLADGSFLLAFPNADDRSRIDIPASNRRAILNGVLEAITASSTATLAHLYQDRIVDRTNAAAVGAVQRRWAVVPPVSVISTPKGWVIEDLFLLTWYRHVHLVTHDFDETIFRVGGSRGSEIGEFIGIDAGGIDESRRDALDVPEGLTIDGNEIGLNEIEFLSKAKWLTEYRERYDDDQFWTIIERHVTAELASEQRSR